MTLKHNRRVLKKVRQKLRREMTAPETKLWHVINRQQLGARFRRQFSIGIYITDFCCPRLKLVIEIDGDTHFNDKAEHRDRIRTRYLESAGFTILRFTNVEVMQNLEAVVTTIKQYVHDPL